MRLWSLSPSCLDASGLVALWREGLLARKVLMEQTKGYKNHPQLIRFRETVNPTAYINAYLEEVYLEALTRGYQFDHDKLTPPDAARTLSLMPLTTGQLNYEWNHLLGKLQHRCPERFERLREIGRPHHHPLFHLIEGNISPWEKLS